MTIPYILGYSRKNPNRGGGGLRMYFSENPHRIFRFAMLPLTHGNSKWVFLEHPSKSHFFFNWPLEFRHALSSIPLDIPCPQPPPIPDFFWNSPFIDPVSKCFAYGWFVQNSQGTVHVISASRNAVDDLILKKNYGPFLWMGFNLLKACATSRRQFTFYH